MTSFCEKQTVLFSVLNNYNTNQKTWSSKLKGVGDVIVFCLLHKVDFTPDISQTS